MIKRAAVLGHPISHSLSPFIFEKLAEKCGTSIKYDILDVEPSLITEKFAEIKKNYAGISITLPFKETMLTFADEKSPEVKAIGATNCLRFGESTMAYNTDVDGLLKTFDRQGLDLKGKSILILGAGGATRALLYAFHLRGATEFTVFNRGAVRLKDLEASLSQSLSGLRINPYLQTSGKLYDLVVNATPVGMAGHKAEDLDFSTFFEGQTKIQMAFDLIYKPLETPFIKEAHRRKIKAIGGLEMLLFQAQKAWSIFFGEFHFGESFSGSLLDALKTKI